MKTPNAILANARYVVVDPNGSIVPFDDELAASAHAKTAEVIYGKEAEVISVDHDLTHAFITVDEDSIRDAEPRISQLEEELKDERQKCEGITSTLRFVYGMLNDDLLDENIASIYHRARGFAAAVGAWEFE